MSVAFAHVGHQIAHRAGKVIVTLTWVRADAYRVTVLRASTGALVDGWAASYTDEHVARAEARRMVQLFADGATITEVETRDAELADLIQASIARRGVTAEYRTAQLQRERAAIEPLAAAANRAELAARIRADFISRELIAA